MNRLKTTEVKGFREEQYKIQNGICALCNQHMDLTQCVADHRHSDGKMRRIIHRNCNLVLGKWENALKRYGIDDVRAKNIAENIIKYMGDTQEIFHPTWKTPEEKKALAAKRRKRNARRRRDL